MRSLSIDILKIVLALFVVFLHMHALRDFDASLSYVLVNGLFRIAVPVFLIISGYYFFYVDDLERLKKWSLRILLLYIIWTIIYVPIWKEDDNYFLNIVFGYHHLWYLIGTFFSGLLLFLVRNFSPKVLLIMILILFGCGYTIQFLGNSHYFEQNYDLDILLNLFPTYRNFLFVCFPFLGMGFLIKKLEIDIRQKPSFLLVLASVLLVIFEAFLNYKVLKLNKKESVDLLFSLLIACPLLFLYCKNITIKTDSKILASISTAIYLIHPLLMEFVYKSPYFPSYQNVIFTVVLLVSSVILVLVNRKVKYLL
jgi:surface polysaccharide O-acyltransferase-like enzyme